jgi:hypothetical protein
MAFMGGRLRPEPDDPGQAGGVVGRQPPRVRAILALLSGAMWGTADHLGGRLSRSHPVLGQHMGLLSMVSVLGSLHRQRRAVERTGAEHRYHHPSPQRQRS